ncbi:MAG: hypothetical protein IKW03_02815 [Clostridia bacterium]|nr:hypothetical protein [Clostridia bacterium]
MSGSFVEENEIPAQNNLENIYSLCGVDKNVKATVILTYYNDNDDLSVKNITIDLGKEGSYEIYRVDNHHNGELTEITDNLSFEIGLFGMVLIREK